MANGEKARDWGAVAALAAAASSRFLAMLRWF